MPLLVSLLAALLAGCAGTSGGGATAEPVNSPKAKVKAGHGDKLLVRLYDVRHNLRLELANESHPDLADVYSELRENNDLKLAPDELMGELLQDLEQIGFDKFAHDGRPPEAPAAPAAPATPAAPAKSATAPVAGAATAAAGRGWVEVRQGDSSRTFLVPDANPTAEQLKAFSQMKLVINEYYTHLGALQYLDNPQGAAIFKGKGT